LERLIGDQGMGSLFKVLALAAPATPQPAGL
jgi:SAM-dependent MidA family methyltransferase